MTPLCPPPEYPTPLLYVPPYFCWCRPRLALPPDIRYCGRSEEGEGDAEDRRGPGEGECTNPWRTALMNNRAILTLRSATAGVDARGVGTQASQPNLDECLGVAGRDVYLMMGENGGVARWREENPPPTAGPAR